MTYRALVSHFAAVDVLPVPVDDIVGWITENTDHKIIRFHPVPRPKKAYRGAFRRRSVSTKASYDSDPEIITDILFGEDLPPEWKRLVITKELTHVFDPEPSRVNSEDKVRRLVPAVMLNELGKSPFLPALEDHLGVLKALALLIPRGARVKLKSAVESNSRSVLDVATYVGVPVTYVDIWLQFGEEMEESLCNGA